MKIHKEGTGIIFSFFIILLMMNLLVFTFTYKFIWVTILLGVASFIFWCFILWFFRSPNRSLIPVENVVYAPADGKVVVIENTQENEYFKDTRKQVSIFMSPLNVHVNRYPVSGQIMYYKYHQGEYLVAWHPKSSTHNERTTVVVKTSNGIELLIRQIAGAVARRVVCYAKEQQKVIQGDELGFIKFGSRVDVFLPTDAKINVSLDQKVIGNRTILAHLS